MIKQIKQNNAKPQKNIQWLAEVKKKKRFQTARNQTNTQNVK